ncbi:MAG: methionyl-tRNA formyltransferase [Terracidiphilus sp.]|jgi:methionyl-tRNA formyltransferase
MKLIFCGTPQFAVPTLKALLAADHEIALVVSQPDRPVGRDRQLVAPPVKLAALVAGLKVAQPEKIRNNPEFRARIEAIAPDAIVVVAYGRLIPPWMLALPRLGCINLHASLLPRYRGAAPIQWAVAMGDTITGNTTMLLEEGLDTGPILLQQAVVIAPQQTAADMFDLLADGGAPLVVKTLAGLDNGTVQPIPQNHAGATFAPILTRENGRMEFAAYTATELKNRWRGFQPWPGAFTALEGKKLIVHRVEVADEPGSQDSGLSGPTLSQSASAEMASTLPGRIHIQGHRLLVACAGNTWLELVEVQLEGKKRLAAAEFLRGITLPANAWLG